MSGEYEKAAVVQAYIKAFEQGDTEAVCALFAENAKVEDPVGTPPHVGLEAVRAFYACAMGMGPQLKLEGPVRCTETFAAFPFSVQLELEGKPTKIDVIDTFEFNDNNKIVSMRAFFGPANICTEEASES